MTTRSGPHLGMVLESHIHKQRASIWTDPGLTVVYLIGRENCVPGSDGRAAMPRKGEHVILDVLHVGELRLARQLRRVTEAEAAAFLGARAVFEPH